MPIRNPQSAIRNSPGIPHSEFRIPHFLGAAPLLPFALALVAGVAFDSHFQTSPAWPIAVFILAAFAALIAEATKPRSDEATRGSDEATAPPGGSRSDEGKNGAQGAPPLFPTSSLRRWVASSLPLLAAAACGALLHFNAVRRTPADDVERFVPAGGTLLRVRGIVTDEPRILNDSDFVFAPWTYGGERTVFTLEARELEEEATRLPAGTAKRRSDPATKGGPGGVPSARPPAGTADGWRPVSGALRVTVREAVLDLRPGRPVELLGTVFPLRPPANPGSFDWASVHRRRGVSAVLVCPHYQNVRGSDEATAPPGGSRSDEGKKEFHGIPPSSLRRWVASSLPQAVRDLLLTDMPTGGDDEVSLLEAMVLGRRSQLSERLSRAFIRTGCLHLVVVSGTHLAAVMFFGLLAGRALNLRRRHVLWLTLLPAAAYAAVVEFQFSVIRSVLMAAGVSAALLIGARAAILNTLAATVAILVVLAPACVFDVGLQISLAAVTGIAVLTPALLECEAALYRRLHYGPRLLAIDPTAAVLDRLHRFNLPHRCHVQFRRWLLVPPAASAAAWLAAAPLIMFHFQRLQPWGVLNSVLLLIPATLVLALGLAALVVAAVSPVLAAPLKWALAQVVAALIGLVEQLARLPGGDFTVPPLPLWLALLYYVLLAAFAWRYRPGRMDAPRAVGGFLPVSRSVQRRANAPIAAAFTAAALATVLWLAWPAGDALTVTTLSVGRGSTHVVELPGGRTLLIDAGSDRPTDIGRHLIYPVLLQRGADEVDRVFVSHPNLDHYSGVPGLIEAFARSGRPGGVGPVITTPYFAPLCPPQSPGRRLLDWLDAQGHPVQTLDLQRRTWTEGGVTFELLWPPEEYDARLEANDTSIVMRLGFAGRSVLFTGDIEDAAQSALIRRGGLESDVLVLPHHGSVRNTTPAFIEAVDPQIVIRSGREPNADTRSALPLLIGDRRFFNTADDGAVTVVIDASGLSAYSHLNSGRAREGDG